MRRSRSTHPSRAPSAVPAPLAALLLAGTVLAGPAFAAADLGIAAATSNATPTAGGAAFSYTLTVTNNGPSDATGIVVLDPMPPGVLFQNVAVVNNPSSPGFGLACWGPPAGTNGTVECGGSLPGAAPSTATITIVAQVTPEVASGVRTNTALVASDTQEASPNTLPNVAAVQQSIQVDAPLSLSMTATPAVVAGDPILYQIVVNNGGNTSALNPALTQSLPAGTRFLGLYGSEALHAACSAAGGGAQVVCRPRSIPSGLHRLVVIAETEHGTTPPGPAVSSATLTPGTGTVTGSPASATTIVTQNLPPVAASDSYSTTGVVPVVVPAQGVKLNDGDDEDLREVLVASLVSGPTSGTLTVPLAADGSFVYTPAPGFAGIATFTYLLTDSRGLQSNTATVSITVCQPTSGAVSGGGPMCAGSSSTVTVTVAGGAPPYTVTLTNGGGTQTGPGPVLTFTVSPAVATTYAVATLTDSVGCPGTGIGSATVTLTPLPATPAAGNNGPVCVGGTLQLSASAVPGATYQWTGPNGFSSAEQNPVLAGFTEAMAGTYTVTTLAAGCASLPATTTVAASASVPLTGTGPDTLCQNGTAPVAVSTAVPGATYAWWVTNETGAAVIVGDTAGIAATVRGEASGIVTVTCQVTDPATSCSNFFHKVVTILPAPIPQIEAPQSADAGATGLVASVPGGTGASYFWTIVNGTITSGQGTASIVFSAGDGGVVVLSVTETGAEGCTSKPATAKVNVYEAGGPCESGPTTLCLNQDRFKLTVAWRDYVTGATGSGNAVRLTPDSGTFWFLSPSNLELFVKVLDGTTVNDRYWVLYGALSDMEYTVTVEDLVTGAVKSYANPAHTQASVADVDAFADGLPRTGTLVVTGAEVGLLTALEAERQRERERSRGPEPVSAALAATLGACAPTPTSLCLNGGRFEVTLSFRNYTDGYEGQGHAEPITADAGTFWFFSPSNVELAVKVLDGTSVNGKFWVLWGALTDVEYTMIVRDTQSGAERTYYNPPHVLASGSDVEAF